MPPDRNTRLSISQFSELLGIEPERLLDVEVSRQSSTITLVLQPKEADETHGPDATGHP